MNCRIYLNLKTIVILLLGIASGLPLALSGSTLALMLLESDVDIAKIAVFGLASLPYSFKYLWAPLIDNIRMPILTRLLGFRLSWLLFVQILLLLVILYLGRQANPESVENLFVLGITVFILTFLSATQDIIIDAYRIEISEYDEQGISASIAVLGYRIGMLLSGTGSLYFAHFFSWRTAYYFIGLLMVPGLIAAIAYGEPKNSKIKIIDSNLTEWFSHAFIKPFADFMSKQQWGWIILFILFYKLSDAYLGMMTTPFLVEIGFSKIELANIMKLYGFISTTLGMLLGGYLIKLFKRTDVLLVLGLILESSSNLIFLLQSLCGHNSTILIFVISIENLCSGLSNTILIAYISNLVNREFTATSYALLSSIAVFGRTTISSSAGIVASYLGWTNFFIFTSLLSIPAAICLYNLYYTQHVKSSHSKQIDV